MENKKVEELEKSIIVAMKNLDFNTAVELDKKVKMIKTQTTKNKNTKNK